MHFAVADAGRDKCLRVDWTATAEQEGHSESDICKDANALLMQHGPEALKYCIANARPLPTDGPFK